MALGAQSPEAAPGSCGLDCHRARSRRTCRPRTVFSTLAIACLWCCSDRPELAITSLQPWPLSHTLARRSALSSHVETAREFKIRDRVVSLHGLTIH